MYVAKRPLTSPVLAYTPHLVRVPRHRPFQQLRVSTLEISRIAVVSQLKHELQAVPIIQRLVRRVILDKHFVVLKGIAGQQIALNKDTADKAIISLQRIFRGRRGREHAAVMRVLRAKRLGKASASVTCMFRSPCVRRCSKCNDDY